MAAVAERAWGSHSSAALPERHGLIRNPPRGYTTLPNKELRYCDGEERCRTAAHLWLLAEQICRWPQFSEVGGRVVEPVGLQDCYVLIEIFMYCKLGSENSKWPHESVILTYVIYKEVVQKWCLLRWYHNFAALWLGIRNMKERNDDRTFCCNETKGFGGAANGYIYCFGMQCWLNILEPFSCRNPPEVALRHFRRWFTH